TLPWSGTDFGSDGIHVNSTQQVYSGPVAKAVRTSIPTFSDYAIGFSNNIVLPIELTYFTVSPSGNDALLSWNTSSEFNSDYFGVERSFDGEQFNQIGIVDAAGYSTLPLDYSFADHDLNEYSADRIYYRLRMVDQDQTFKYSEVRWLDLSGNSDHPMFEVFPNPFSDELSVAWNAAYDGLALIQLCDVSGKIIFEQHDNVVKGNNYFTMNQFSSLAQGVYLLRFSSGRNTFTQKVIKE
ncbi:MAG: T9SS type A sorting domain-containing protein, partial [Chitinophagales bacterium]